MENYFRMLLPCNLIDSLVSFAFRLQMPRIAEGLIYWFKGAHKQNLVSYKTSEGVNLWLNPHNYIDRILLSGQSHDQDVMDALKKTIQDGDVFWDIGANIGYVSLSILKMKPNCQIVAFEPSPFSLVQLYINNELNGNKITIMPFALSFSDEIREFSLKINRNSGQSTLLPQKKFNYDFSLQIQTKIGDDLVRSGLVPVPSVVKIDVEGAEFIVLSGMKKILANPKLRVVVFEGPSDCHSKVVELLRSYQFHKIIRLNENTQTDFIAFKGVT